MIDLNKYNVKEIVAAIMVVRDIVAAEDFALDISEQDNSDDYGDKKGTGLFFNLIDKQNAYLGDIGSDRFSNLGAVLDRLDTYHNDSLYRDYEDRIKQGEVIDQDDWVRKALIFIESNYCQDLISAIDVETYNKHKDSSLESISLNPGETEKYVKDGHFDAVGYLCDKSIALAIIQTESAYLWFEHEGKFYLSDYGLDDVYKSNEGFKTEVLKALNDNFFNMLSGPGGFEPCWTVHDTYAEVITAEFGQVKDDMRDIGLYDDEDNWQFYLSEYELEYVGLTEEMNKLKGEYMDIRMFSLNDVSDEFLQHHLEVIVENAKNRAVADNVNTGSSKSDFDKGMEQ